MIATLTERISSSGSIDSRAGVIRGVKFLSRISRNGREYTADAMMEATKLYENTKVFIDHPSAPGASRSIKDWVGSLRNIRFRDGALFGDLHLRASHRSLCEDAKSFPQDFGLSHNAEGRTIRRNGKLIVEEITKVRSVDLVVNPATVSGLFESAQDQHQHVPLVQLPRRGRPANWSYSELQEDVTADPTASDEQELDPDVWIGALRQLSRIIELGNLSDAEKLRRIKEMLGNREFGQFKSADVVKAVKEHMENSSNRHIPLKSMPRHGGSAYSRPQPSGAGLIESPSISQHVPLCKMSRR